MEINDLGYTGSYLKEEVFKAPEEREFFADHFITKHSSNMYYAPDGIGKSTLLLQMSIEGASGYPVFGEFKVKEPLKIIHIMTERHIYEAFERIIAMSKNIEINWENIFITDKLQGINILNERELISLTDKICFINDLVFLKRGSADLVNADPIYAWLTRGLVNEEGANAVANLQRRIKSRIGASFSYSHHTNRGQRNRETGKRENEDMYGGRFLSANCTAVYSIFPTDKGTKLKNEKDTLKCLHKGFYLEYDPETYISKVTPEFSLNNKEGQFKSFINNCFHAKKRFTFDDVLTSLLVSHSYSRGLISREVSNGTIKNVNSNGIKALYEVLREAF